MNSVAKCISSWITKNCSSQELLVSHSTFKAWNWNCLSHTSSSDDFYPFFQNNDVYIGGSLGPNMASLGSLLCQSVLTTWIFFQKILELIKFHQLCEKWPFEFWAQTQALFTNFDKSWQHWFLLLIEGPMLCF